MHALTNTIKKNFFVFMFMHVLSSVALSAPVNMNFQANIKKPDGSSLEASDVSFRFKYLNTTGTCTVYIEDFPNISMVGKAGNISIKMGSGTRSFPTTGPATLVDTFSNRLSNSMPCWEHPLVSPYSPLSADENRRLVVEFVYTGSGGVQVINGIEINSVPYAMNASVADNADRLGGFAANLFTRFSDFQTCPAGEFLLYDGSAFVCDLPSSFTGTMAGDVTGNQGATSVTRLRGIPLVATAPTLNQVLQFDGTNWVPTTLAAASSGTVTAVSSANGDIVIINPNTTPQLTLNSGVGPNQILKLNGTSQIPAVDGSLLTNLDAGQIATGTLPINRGGTNATTANGALNNLLPAQGTHAGKVLQTDGTNTSWVLPSAGTVTSVGATLPLTSTGGATPTIAMPAATAVQDGYLSSADFTTFNSKVSSQWSNNGADIFFNTGRVGIGTNNPGVPLSVYQPAFGTGFVVYNASENNDAIQLQNTNFVSTINGINNTFNISNNGTPAIIMEGGNVGIAKTSPAYALDVTGDVNVTGNFKINGVNIGSGTIGGSGTTNIVPKFTAAGTIGNSNISDNGTLVTVTIDASVNGVRVGRGGGAILSNTAVGNFALSANTTGTYNSALGYSAFVSSTTGNYNSAIGSFALAQNTTGSGNTVTGFAAGQVNTTGDNNSIYGQSAMAYNQTGSDNAAFGASALFNNTTGVNNTAVGANAGISVTTGSNNILLGNGAANALTTGSNNIVIGSNDGSTIATTNNNIIIADGAGNIRQQIDSAGRVGIGMAPATYMLNVNGDINIPAGSNFKINGVNLGSGTIGGSGTTNKISKFTASGTIGDSNVTDNGSFVSISTDTDINGMYIGRGPGNIGSNTVLGNSALVSNTTGMNNTTTGVNSLNQNTSGNGNTANGNAALYANTTGSSNLAFGLEALRFNTTGNSNVANGYQALYSNTTGNGNTALGMGSGSSITTGSGNTALGMGSGSAITTGSNNVVIGSNTGSTIATTNNNIIISDGSGSIRQQIDSAGLVGIGMAPSTYALSVNGDINIPAGSNFKINGVNLGSGTIGGSGTTDKISKFTAAGTIGDSNISDNGTLVGVSRPIHQTGAFLSNGEWTNLLLEDLGSGSNGIQFKTYLNDIWNIRVLPSNIDDQMTFGKGSTPTLVVNGNDRVGIGTTTPVSKLDVNGGLTVGSYAGTTAAPTNGINVSGQVLVGASTDFADTYGPHQLLVKGANDKNVMAASTSDDSAQFAVYLNGGGAYTRAQVQNGSITNSNFGIFTNNDVPQFTLTTNGGAKIGRTLDDNAIVPPANGLLVAGNVGIGTNSPGFKLDVNGDINISAGSNFKINGVNIGSGSIGGSGTTNKVSKFTASGTIGDSNITDNGTNVGIGNSNPQAPFQVGGGSDNSGEGAQLFVSPTSGDGIIAVRNPDHNIEAFMRTFEATGWPAYTTGLQMGTLTYHDINFVTNDTVHMVISKDGRVGIDVLSPAYSLDVDGDINISTGHNYKINGVNVVAGGITALTGDVTAAGPGSAATTIAPLAVTDAKINDVAWGKITSKPTTITGYGITDAVRNAGVGAGNIVSTIQSGNTAGRPAFGTDGRIYMDTQAGAIYRDSGAAWVTVASSGGGSGVTGTGTIDTVPKFTAAGAIGNSNITDDGTRVSISTDSLINSVLVGRGPGAYATNTVLGNRVLNNASAGSNNNTAVGYYALNMSASAGNNTAVGSNALTRATSSGSNVAVGSDALANVLTNGNSTAIGYSALNQATGGQNIAIGSQAGQSITTGANNVILGSNNGATIATSSNNIIIADGAGNIRQQVDSSGLVGIGMAPATYRLSVNGDINLPLGSNYKINGVDIAAAGVGIGKTTYVVRAATTMQLGALSGTAALDGVAIAAGNRVLVKNQTLAQMNGVYIVAAGAWTRATDLDAWTEALGYNVYVTEGNNNAGVAFTSTAPVAGTLGTTAIDFFASGGNSTRINTQSGVYALSYNSSGTSNTATGYQTMRLNMTGSSNTGMGTMALFSNASGNSNTAIGALALTTASGSNNTAVGTSAGTSISSGTNNAVFGNDSGSAITTGSNNVIIGSNTGSTIATSSNNIIISDGAGNARMIANSSGNVAIGNIAPRAKLEVDGTVLNKPATSNATTTINFNTGNLQYTAQDCQTYNLHNLKDGGSYMFVVQGINPTTCIFNGFSDAGTTAITVKMPPDHGLTTNGKQTVYNLVVMGTTVYISWTPGY